MKRQVCVVLCVEGMGFEVKLNTQVMRFWSGESEIEWNEDKRHKTP